MELARREQLLDRVFKAAKEKLPELQKRPDYDQIAAMLLREALSQLKVKKAEIRADEITQKSLKMGALDEISRELNGEFAIAGTLEEGTGVVVDAAEGKLHYDNTLETRLSRLAGRSALLGLSGIDWRKAMSDQAGTITWISGPVVRARGSRHIGMLELVEVGEERLVGEVIGLRGDTITVQVYEETAGMQPGAPIYGTGLPLSVELGTRLNPKHL